MDSPAENTHHAPGVPGSLYSRALAVVNQPALVGVYITCGLNWVTLASAFRNDQYEGADATNVRRFLSNEYHTEVVRAVGFTFALSVMLGLFLGTVVAALIRMRRRWLNRSPLGAGALVVQTALGVCLTLALVAVDDVIMRPALYQDALLNAGACASSVQVFLTDHVNRGALWVSALLLLVVWVALPALRNAERGLRWRSLVLPLGLLALTAVIVFLPRSLSRPGSARSTKNDKLNVLIIAADSLRPDRITPSIAPHIAALKQRGVDFSHAYTPLARTFPAWVSILTGNYPHHHGIRNMFPRWETRTKDFHSVPASFASAGYSTSVVSDFAGDIFRRVDLGFQHYHSPTLNMRELLLERVLREMHVASDADELTRDVLNAIDASPEAPFFLTVFYSTTHFPYAAPSPYYKRYTNPKYAGRFRYAKADTLGADVKLSTDDVLQTRRLFDGAVAAVDAAVGELVSGVASRGLLDRTIIVVTADHGETLYEYGRGQGHGDHLLGDENLHVPLILSMPEVKPGSVPANVSLVDLGPTLCELARVSCAPDMDGRSLAAAVHGQQLDSRPVFAETGLWFTEDIPEVPPEQRIPYPELTRLTEIDRNHVDEIVIRREWEPTTIAVKHRMVRDGNYKLVYMPTRTGPKSALFDTAMDPGEVTDVAAKMPDIARRLQAALMQWIMIDPSVDNRHGVLLPREQGEAPKAER
jgi:arylsulfatase A-like enzyme